MNQGNHGGQTFIPPVLEDTLDITITYDMLTALSKASRSIGNLDGISVFLENADALIRILELQDILSLWRLEGKSVTALDYFEAILTGNKTKFAADMESLRKEVKELHLFYKSRERISFPLLKKLYHSSTGVQNGSQPSLLRSSQQADQSNSLTAKYTKKYHLPTSETLEQLSGNLFEFLDEESLQPLLMKASMAYAQWIFLQPFEAKNANYATFLIMKWLIDQQVIQYPLIAVNTFFEDHRVEYQFRLLDLQQTGNWDEWLTFFILGMDETARNTREAIYRTIEIQKVLPESLDTISGHVEYAKELFQLLFNQPLIHIKYVANKLDVAFGTANSLVQQFEEMDILTEITGQSRNKRYLFQDYFKLFFELDA